MKFKILQFIFCFSILVSPHLSFGQLPAESNNFITYDTIYNGPGQTWRIRISRPANMFTAGHPDTASRPAIITMPGIGEVGTNYANLQKYGPHYWLNNGWDGSVITGSGKHYPILITVIAEAVNPRASSTIPLIQHLLNTYHIKRNSVHLAGLSMGAFTWAALMNAQTSAGDETGMKMIKSLVLLQGAGQGATSGLMGSAIPYDPTGFSAFGHWAAKYNGKFFGLEGTNDGRKVWEPRDNMNDSIPNSAYFSYETYGGGSHCCWNTMYDPNNKNWRSIPTVTNTNIGYGAHPNSMGSYTDGYSIFQWMIRQGDTSIVNGGTPANQSPTANAGSDKTITLPTNTVTVTGSGIDPDGTITGYQWTKLTGPSTYTIATPMQAQTAINNLVQGVYTFELRVTDNQGATGKDTVQVTVNAAGNQVPTANAGTNQSITLPTNIVTLTGTGTDPDGTISGYQWTKLTGPASYTIASPTQAQTAINNLVQGVYTFELRVTDNQGATGKDTIEVTVNTAANTNSNSNGVKVGTGEYQVGFIDSAKQLWGLGNLSNIGINGIGTVGVPKRMLVTPFDLKFNSVVGALHGLGAIDTAGYVWVVGDNDQFQHGQGNSINPILLPQRITVDSAGNPFTNVRDLVGWFVKDGSNGYNGFYAVKQDGTLWTWGRTVFGMRAVGVYGYDSPRPVQIIMPGGRLIKQIIAGQFAIALCTDGTVWTWGQGASANNLGMTSPTDDVKWYPRQLTSLSNIKQIAGGSNWNYALSNSNVLYGWGSYGDNLGNSNGLPIPTPSLLNNITNNLPHPINTIVTNSAVTHVILTDGSLWGWGDNGQGTVGNGQRVVFTIDGGNPFNRGNLQVVLPEHIAPGIIFDTVFGATTYTYHTYARDTSNNLYCWGRGKSAVLANQLRPTSSAITATYGNSWDIAYPTPVNPFTITTSYFQTSDYCVKVASGGSPCDQYAIPSNTRPNANAGNDTSITSNTFRLNATASTDNVFISRYEWSQVSGPSLASIDLPASKTPLVSGLITGTYVFKVLTEDNGWFLDSSNITIYVNSSPPPNQSPTANAGSDKTITLPTNTVMLTGSGIDPDGTITGYQWTKLTGPATYTIATPTQAQTAINNLVQGVYTFELRVTDNQGATGNDTVQITVNAANQSPTANAGSDKTITLPTNTVTITGSGIDPDGTISGYQWTKLTGPSTYTIASPTQAQTAINNLVQGVYTFELRVTDNQGATGKDTVQVTVDAAANQSPTANAGSDKTITLPTNTVTVTGSGIDPDGIITGYQWTKLTGPATYTIASPTQAQTLINDLIAGEYSFELSVTDIQGAVDRDTMVITVNEALENNRTFLIFPNPAVESINIQFDKGTDQNKSVISIYTISGILVYSEEYVISPIERARPKQINISKLPAGIYFIKVDSNKNNSKGLKFIKQ
ncbi:MAG: T9SS type A sorting domain-containing protein [Ignavibacterium sp.]|nr:T9SS type A sorting domain-containing protein [Ignavibacterium sp.]